MAQLFLVSSSKYQDGEFFDHCKDDLQNFLQPQKNTKVLFVPYALKDHDWYASIIRPVFKEIGCQLVGIHEVNNPRDAVEDCDEYEAVFVGGGNTFRLLQKLHETGIFFNLKRAVQERSMKYIGSNAGSNLACPTIKTTNDMPIIQPHDFNGLNLINFQINPHYPAKKLLEHMGESRRTRLLEFQEENDFDVIGVPESGFIEVDGPNIQFRGKEAAFWFKNGSVKPVYPNTHWTNL